MAESSRRPTAFRTIRAIAERELRAAARKRFVRWLFLLSLGPVVVFATILLVRVVSKQQLGYDLSWDPVELFFRVQALPVGLLALGVGAPLIARDREAQVMFLYATRPVRPWHYATGKLAAVFVPTFGLFVLPGLTVLGLRLGLLESVGLGASLLLAAAVVAGAFFLSFGFSGVALGASALTKRSRWAIVLTMALAFLPDAAVGLLLRGDAFPVGVVFASERLVSGLFLWGAPLRTLHAAFVLGVWGVFGWAVTAFKVGGEMTP